MLGPVTAGCRERLIAHYGDPVTGWLERVPALLMEAAARWDLRLDRYHDGGHASALVTATTSDGASVVLKAWFDRERYAHETAALRWWEPVNGRVIRLADNERAVACLTLVGGAPGGASRPADDDALVASALTRLHQQPAPQRIFPDLDAYLASEVDPRIRRRARRFAGRVPARLLDLGLCALDRRSVSGRTALLHADLYQENVPFDGDGRPVFLDPLPMHGDVAFDWAFFVVYHDLGRDPVARLRLAREVGRQCVADLLPWCLTLCVDGLLYYHDVGDSRVGRMANVLAALAVEGDLS